MTDKTFENITIEFEQFLSLVGNVLSHEKEINIIQNKLRRHFNATSSSYLSSADFLSSLNQIHSSFSKKDKSIKYFTLLASFDEQMKNNSVKSRRSHRSSNEPPNSIHNNASVKPTQSTNGTTVIISPKSSNIVPLRSSPTTPNEHNISPSTSEQTVEQLLDSCNNIIALLNESQIPMTNTESTITTDSVNTFEQREKKIHKLERRLNSLSKTISKLEEKDMSLDEMEHCDLYNVESNLKKQAYEIYTKLAELKKQSSSVERILDQPVTLKEIDFGHRLINEALENMVNQTKFLPPFHDVLDTIEKTNDKYQLNLTTDALKDLAEKSFRLIGTKVKDRRMADFNDIMNSRLPEDFDIEQNDPALNSIEFEKVLLENEREAVIQTEKIFEEFSRIDPQLEPEVDLELSEESSIESDEEEENEEVKMESDEVVEPSGNKPEESQYDIVDILPPFSSKSSSPASSVVNETSGNEDSLEATVQISLNNHTLTIPSTPSIPLKRATCDSFASIAVTSEADISTVSVTNYTQTSRSITIIHEHEVQTLIPRRKPLTPSKEIRCHRYEQQLTNDGSSVAEKRSSSKDMESSESKKLKEQSKFVILD